MKAGECRKLLELWQKEGTLENFLPEVAALKGVPQPEKFHSEGDVFIHTMLALDSVSDDSDPRVFWGVLFHDIGKAVTTVFVDGRWRAHGHAEAGAELVPLIMTRIGYPELASDVAWLVRHHLFHFSWNLHDNVRLTGNQRKFMEHPLFCLLLQLCIADADGSRGINDKGRKIMHIAELYAGLSAGESPSERLT